jgi:hypothetical protein
MSACVVHGPGEGEKDPGIGNDAVSNSARAELWQTVLPILVEGEDGSMEVVGTGFVVQVKGRQAHLVTAGHVCEDIQRRDRPPVHTRVHCPISSRQSIGLSCATFAPSSSTATPHAAIAVSRSRRG